jgi:hypothetical protein
MNELSVLDLPPVHEGVTPGEFNRLLGQGRKVLVASKAGRLLITYPLNQRVGAQRERRFRSTDAPSVGSRHGIPEEWIHADGSCAAALFSPRWRRQFVGMLESLRDIRERAA